MQILAQYNKKLNEQIDKLELSIYNLGRKFF